MLDKALALAKLGLSVFPVKHTKENEKIPLTSAGHLDSTTDETIIEDMWRVHPDAHVGVHTGASGINVLDIDMKDNIDGFESLGFDLETPDTFSYETGTGGWHFIYSAPEGVNLNGAAPYRGLPNVDRRAGSSWIMWVGEVPKSRDEFTPAPEWLNDPARVRSAHAFEGDLKDWYDSLVPGEPSAAVRRSISRIKPDMGHSEMVSAQHHAIRLGAEGHPGVQEYLEALEEAWLNRPAENHTTPEGQWEYKFAEALASGIEQFGNQIEVLKSLSPFKVAEVPSGVPTNLLVGGAEATKAEWSQAMHSLMEAGVDDEKIVSILWGAPRTRPLSMDWGVEFVAKRVHDAREKEKAPEPSHLPAILDTEALDTEEIPALSLLTDEERDRVNNEYSFVDMYIETGHQTGFANEKYFEAAAWTVASMAVGFRAFLVPSATDTMPLNMWFTTLAFSGTGKTRAAKFQETIMNIVHDRDNLEQSYKMGANFSPQGLHIALLERNRQPFIMFADEASSFFKSLANDKWMQEAEQTMSHFYEGKIDPINKVSQSHLKGKSGLTSFNLHLYSTPENFFELITDDQFTSGFLARMLWVVGDEPEYVPDSITFTENRSKGEDVTKIDPLIQDLGVYFRTLRYSVPENTPVYSSQAALIRQQRAANDATAAIQGREKFNILEPAMRRISWDYIRKASAIMALTSGYLEIQEIHVLQALEYVEKWVQSLFRVVEQVNRSVFYRQAMEIVAFVTTRRGSKATEAAIYKRFAETVTRDPRELQAKLDLMIRSGRLTVETIPSGGLLYRAN